MLTADLVNATQRKGFVVPRYVKPDAPASIELADGLISIFNASTGRTRSEIQSELDEHLGNDPDFLLHRGLAKLLFDRGKFATPDEFDGPALRARVFESAATLYQPESVRDAGDAGNDEGGAPPSARALLAARDTLLAEIAAEIGHAAEVIERSLYCDLKEEQRLTAFERIDARELLDRYNVALAQGVLLRASEVRLTLARENPRRLRELFRVIKFSRLLYRVSESENGDWELTLDGPLSVLRASQKYGLALANLVPTLLHFESWRLEAEVQWGARRARRRFVLESGQGLRSHRHLRGQHQPDEFGWFEEQFKKLKTRWEISSEGEIVPLGGQGVLIPDHVFTHRESGRKVTFEVLGFWRRGSVDSRAKLIARYGPEHFIIGLSKELHAEKEKLDAAFGDGEGAENVYLFRTHPIARDVAKLLERFEG